MSKAAKAKERLRAWREYPAQFVHDNFHIDPDEWQVEVLNAMGGGKNPSRRVCMRACTGPGKSATLAWGGWHRLSCFASRGEHPKGAALSITQDNLKDNLWAELSKWQKRSEFLTREFTWTKGQIYQNDHPETWFISARSFAKDADTEAIGRALSGLHSKYPFVLLDEIGDMPVAVGQKAEQIFTGAPEDAAIIAAGNPTSTDGLLYLVCNKQRKRWELITITADPDDPRRTPRVPVELARQQIEEYGRDNPWVMATILGLFPPVGFNALLGIGDVERAMERHYSIDQYEHAAKIIGVDVAREGDDCSVIFPRQGVVAFPPKILRNLKSHELAGHVARKEDDWQADGVIIDGTGGWGSGVLDAYEQMQRRAVDCQFSGKASEPKYRNKRAEIWFEMAEWVKRGGALPPMPELVNELTSATYSFYKDQFMIAPKEEMKKKLGKSPDLADALAVTFAEPIMPRPKHELFTSDDEYDPFARA